MIRRRNIVKSLVGCLGISSLSGCSHYINDNDNTPNIQKSEISSGEESVFATKDRRVLYTQTSVRNARSNINSNNQFKKQATEITSLAETLTKEFTSNELWQSITGQKVPRAAFVDPTREIGSPTHGTEIYEQHGAHYPWELDPREETWKVIDPMTGMKYPTNDFQSYLKSGRDGRGFFDPDLADDRYLINELYPERGEMWGVDDGYGWHDKNGNLFTFVAYYNHWAVWTGGAHFEERDWLGIRDMARVLGRSYVFTGEQRYARAAAILLDRIADAYPDMNLKPYQASEGFVNSHGGTGKGKIFGSIWEHVILRDLLDCYDAIFPAMDSNKLVQFLRQKADKYDIGPKSTVAQIRENIEKNIVREVLPSVKSAQIRGNFGLHQSVLAKSAVILDEPDGYTKEALDFMFRAGGLKRTDGRDFVVTGGNVMPQLVDTVDRDGHNDEAAPHYNIILLEQIRRIADVLDGYEAYEGADLYEHPAVEQTHKSQIPLTMLNGRFQPQIGDNEQTGEPGLQIDIEEMIDGFARYRDSEFAQISHLLNDNSVEGIHGDIFDANPEQIRRDIEERVNEEGPLNLPSQTLAGYGFTALRDGSPPTIGDCDTQRAVWLYYGRNMENHPHKDTLNLGVFAHGLNLAPDLGYPERTGRWPKRHNWTSNTISHNTVIVDEQPQKPQWVSEPKAFDKTERVDLVEVEAPNVYPETERYQRVTALINVDEMNSYAVDFFRIDGGTDHHFSFHGAEGPVATSGLDLAPQNGGTYAGEDVRKPDRGEDTEFNENVGNGFNYLYNVERDENPENKFSVEWDIVDTWDVRDGNPDVNLRLTMLGTMNEVALADGDPPQMPKSPDRLKYVLAHRTEENLRTTFTSVIEPYEDVRAISSIEEVPLKSETGRGKALKISLKSGRTDYIASTTSTGATHEIEGAFEFSGTFAVYAEMEGKPRYAYLHEGTYLSTDMKDTLIERDRPYYEGEVVDFTRELSSDNELIVEFTNDPTEGAEELVGNWIFVETENERNGAYEICGISTERGEYTTLDLGDKTTVRELTDPQNPDVGYKYIIEAGDRFRIPMSDVWRQSKNGQ
jgi:hypothetical protein